MLTIPGRVKDASMALSIQAQSSDLHLSILELMVADTNLSLIFLDLLHLEPFLQKFSLNLLLHLRVLQR